MPPRQDVSRFIRRVKQQEFRDFVEAHPTLDAYPVRLPTGYGKTEAIIDGYDVLRTHNAANRLLIIVPTDTQEEAYTKSLERKARRMGIYLSGTVYANGEAKTIRYHRKNEAEIFVTTVQRLLFSVKASGRSGNWLADLLSTGHWIGAADEYHHYSDPQTFIRSTPVAMGWGEAIRSLANIRQWIAMSATPERKIGSTIFGQPVVSASYEDGLNEGVLKDVRIRTADYGVDVQLPTYTAPVYMTTTQIRDESSGEDIDEWEARKQLRYLSQYCSPILFHAASELTQLFLVAPREARPQMLIYAFSCLHAESLCKIMRGIAPGMSVDWVGTGIHGRSDQENKQVIDAFLDDYDEDGKVKKLHRLDILVQVRKADEGFDSVPVCVIVDLTLTGFGPQKIQQYGRGTRHYHGLLLTIFVPTDSEVSKIASERYRIFDRPMDSKIEEPPDKTKDREPRDIDLLPTLHVLNAQLIGTEDYAPTKGEVIDFAPHLAQAIAVGTGRPVHFNPEGNDEDYQVVRNAMIGYQRRTALQQATEMKADYWNSKVTWAVGQVARDLVSKAYPDGFTSQLLGKACALINTRWKNQQRGHDAMTAKDFEDKYQWLCDQQAKIRDGGWTSWGL